MKGLAKFEIKFRDVSTQITLLICDAHKAHELLDDLEVPEVDLSGNDLSLTDRIAWLRCWIIFVKDRTAKDQQLYDIMKCRPENFIPRKFDAEE